jgi:signal transduction histidine kinase
MTPNASSRPDSCRRRGSDHVDSLSAMAAGLSHDFNNFLAAILGNAVIVKRCLAPDALCAEHVRQIESTTQEAIARAADMLRFSGRGQVDIARLNLGALIRRIACVLKGLAPRGVKFQVRVAPNLPPCDGNEDFIHRSIVNLVENAADALADMSGSIVVRLDTLRVADGSLDGFLFAEYCRPGRYVRVRVSDTGRGMTRRVKARMFDPFFSTKIRGRGMGLTVVFATARCHRGALNVETAPRKGTTVTLLLPCSAA